MRRERRLIIALDVRTRAEALRIASETAGLCDAFKVNYPLVLPAGLGVVDELATHGPVLCDLKVADIPVTNQRIVEEVFRHEAAGVIVHGFPGEDSLRACVEAATGDVFVVAFMSHPGAAQFFAPASDALAHLTREAGASGIIVGATRPERIRELRDLVGDLLILSPGIGPQGGDPAEALRAGADHLIVGRRITQSPDPAQAARGVLEEIGAATEGL